MVTGLALFAATLVLRAASAGRHVRGRLTVTAFTFAVYALVSAAITYLSLSADLRAALTPVLPLLLAFGVINGTVALGVNPWRADRLPDRFPNIVQDTIVIVLFAIAATVILQEKIFATTAVGAVVIGFALQDTLGNLFAGLAIQIDKPFRIGHWIRLGDIDGQVSEITWRATKVRTKAGNFVIVPNSTLSKDTITNYSEPTLDTRIEVDVGVSYDAAPNLVKATIMAALREVSELSSREPEVLIVDFGAYAILYRIRVWVTDFAADERIRDRIRSAVYYAFRRDGIVIPYPIQTEYHLDAPAPITTDPAAAATALRRVSIFASLDDSAIRELAGSARSSVYALGEAVVRQGDPGASMFVIVRGGVVVSVETDGREVARLGEGEFFGEMSLLTGASRNATIRATSDLELLEITVEAFRTFVLANPAAVESIGAAVAKRAAELAQLRDSDAAGAAPEPPGTFSERVRRFLGLMSSSRPSIRG